MRTELALLSLVAWVAFVFSRTLQRRKIPELVAFLLVGAVVGPAGLGVIEKESLERLAPLTEVALAVLMFVIGERVSRRSLRANRWVLLAGFLSYSAAALLVYGVARWLGGGPTTSLLLAVLGGAGAPMTIASVISSAKTRGNFAGSLLGTHAVADALTTIAFAAVVPIALLRNDPDVETADAVVTFLRLGVGGAGLGVGLGFLVARLSSRIETTGELLLLVLVHVLVAATVANVAELSLPLAALVMGAVVASATEVDTSQRIFVAVRGVEQPLYLVFFALAGASIHIDEIPDVGLLGLGYVVARVLGKFGGAFAGGLIGRLPLRHATWLGAGQVAQAGVAVGLAVLASEILPETGGEAATVVLGSVVVFELVGPLLAARGLRRTVAIQSADTEPEDGEDTVDESLPRHVLLASPASLEAPAWLLDWCARTGAELTLLAPPAVEGDDRRVELLRQRASQENVPVHTAVLPSDRSFVNSVIDAVTELQADLVVVVTLPMNAPGAWMRSGPEERIARAVPCPVLLLKGRAAVVGPDGKAEQPERPAVRSPGTIG